MHEGSHFEKKDMAVEFKYFFKLKINGVVFPAFRKGFKKHFLRRGGEGYSCIYNIDADSAFKDHSCCQ